MTLVFAPNWQEWDVRKAQRAAAKAAYAAAPSNKKLKQVTYEKANKAIRKEGAHWLKIADEPSLRAAVQRASANFNDSPEAALLFADAVGEDQTVTITQGSHQDEDSVLGGGFMLHFDAKSSRGTDGTFHLYLGQKMTGQLAIIEVSFMKAGTSVSVLPKTPEI